MLYAGALKREHGYGGRSDTGRGRSSPSLIFAITKSRSMQTGRRAAVWSVAIRI